MADGLLDENKNAPDSEKDEAVPFSLRCGWKAWRPDWLQRFANPKWFVCAIALFSIVQGKNIETRISCSDNYKRFFIFVIQSGD